MPRTVSATEAKNRFGSIVIWVLNNQDEVVVESRGAPTVVILPFTQYQQVKELQEQARRREALARLEALREKVRARNLDMDEEQAEDLAGQISREAIQGMVDEGKINIQA